MTLTGFSGLAGSKDLPFGHRGGDRILFIMLILSSSRVILELRLYGWPGVRGILSAFAAYVRNGPLTAAISAKENPRSSH